MIVTSISHSVMRETQPVLLSVQVHHEVCCSPIIQKILKSPGSSLIGGFNDTTIAQASDWFMLYS
jgi:hypothetical protein